MGTHSKPHNSLQGRLFAEGAFFAVRRALLGDLPRAIVTREGSVLVFTLPRTKKEILRRGRLAITLQDQRAYQPRAKDGDALLLSTARTGERCAQQARMANFSRDGGTVGCPIGQVGLRCLSTNSKVMPDMRSDCSLRPNSSADAPDRRSHSPLTAHSGGQEAAGTFLACRAKDHGAGNPQPFCTVDASIGFASTSSGAASPSPSHGQVVVG